MEALARAQNRVRIAFILQGVGDKLSLQAEAGAPVIGHTALADDPRGQEVAAIELDRRGVGQYPHGYPGFFAVGPGDLAKFPPRALSKDIAVVDVYKRQIQMYSLRQGTKHS